MCTRALTGVKPVNPVRPKSAKKPKNPSSQYGVPDSWTTLRRGCVATQFFFPDVLGEWLLFGLGLVVDVCRLCMMYLFYLECLPILLSVPASCHCDRCFCHSPHAVRSACISAFIHLERLLHLPLRPCRSHAACGPCCLHIGALFVLSRLLRTGRSRHGRAPYARYGTNFFLLMSTEPKTNKNQEITQARTQFPHTQSKTITNTKDPDRSSNFLESPQ
jgi:hypothetical protein